MAGYYLARALSIPSSGFSNGCLIIMKMIAFFTVIFVMHGSKTDKIVLLYLARVLLVKLCGNSANMQYPHNYCGKCLSLWVYPCMHVIVHVITNMGSSDNSFVDTTQTLYSNFDTLCLLISQCRKFMAAMAEGWLYMYFFRVYRLYILWFSYQYNCHTEDCCITACMWLEWSDHAPTNCQLIIGKWLTLQHSITRNKPV